MRTDLGRALTVIFERIYVINLPERADRRREVAAQMRRIGLRLDAPPVRLFPARRFQEKDAWPSVGARGCFMSHLSILQEAADEDLKSIAILEDDANWTPALLGSDAGALQELGAARWEFLHGGPPELEAREGPVRAAPLDPASPALTTHFIGLRGDAIRAAAERLSIMTSRSRGDPRGGPMHVDGAYNWFRRERPEFAGAVCRPGIAYQRSSRTDVHDLRLLDRMPVISTFAGWGRRLKNRVESRG